MSMNTTILTTETSLESLTTMNTTDSIRPHSATSATTLQPTRGQLWTGRIMSGLAAAFLLLDGVMKFVQPAPVIEGTLELGYTQSALIPMGVALLGSLFLYLIPRTAVLGAILLTGYFGGAVATHLRVDNPLFSHTLFPVYFGILIWGGLYLRDTRLRALLPFRK